MAGSRTGRGDFLIQTPRPGLNTSPASREARGQEHFVSCRAAGRPTEASQAQFKPCVPARAPTLGSPFDSRRGGRKYDDPRASPFKKHPHSSLAGRRVNPRESHRIPPASSSPLTGTEERRYFPAPRSDLTRQRGLSCGQSAGLL